MTKKQKNQIILALVFIASVCILIASCNIQLGLHNWHSSTTTEITTQNIISEESSNPSTSSEIEYTITLNNKQITFKVPTFSTEAYYELNDNTPYFTKEEIVNTSYETYGELDSLGRCTTCISCVGKDLMPTEERGSIGTVKPSGWQTVKYDIISGKYLYNRCHLIGYQLTAENANKQNLITGTRYLNIEGMLPFENLVADYIKETNNHVMYRVTPIFLNDNLVASGVLMEAISVEDNGAGICYCVFCYNNQPGIEINYKDGTSELS